MTKMSSMHSEDVRTLVEPAAFHFPDAQRVVTRRTANGQGWNFSRA